MLKKSWIWVSIILLVLVIVSGCSTTNTQQAVTKVSSNQNAPVNEEQNTQEIVTTYPLTIQDDTGANVNIVSQPKRIISFIPSITETLFALGLGDSVVAVTVNDNYPTDVQKRVEYVFPDGLNPNMEQIVNLNPDLILMGSFNQQMITNIQSLHIPSLKFDPKNIDEIYQTIEKIGLITGANQQATQLVASMKQKEKSIEDKVSSISPENKVRVWAEISDDLWTAGKGTFIDELITKAGGVNIVEDSGWIQYNEEKVLEKNPQVILVTYGYYVPNAVEAVLGREGWQQLDAIKNKRVFDVNSDTITRTGPRIIDGLEEVAKALYPNLIK